MSVLLDTSYLYDLMETSGKFSDNERRFFAEQEAELFVSAVSIWEMRLKYRARHPSGKRKSPFNSAVSIWEMRLKYRARHPSGKRKSPFNPDSAVAMVERQDVTSLPMTMQHAARELEVPIPHKDPFDELLLVQAQEEGLRSLTADRQLIGHPLAITA